MVFDASQSDKISSHPPATKKTKCFEQCVIFCRNNTPYILSTMAKRGLLERLQNGENILVAEGYMFEFARRGYLKLGGYVPEVVIDHPDLVIKMHEEFVHAGSDVVLAFTYFGHREKMKSIGREAEVEELNRKALEMAKKVADENGCLFAGGISHTQIYDKDDPQSLMKCKAMFKEMIGWAVEAGVDFIVGETFGTFGEAMLALECIKEYGKGVPAVITLNAYVPDDTVDDVPLPEACRLLEEAGAAVVGLNCSRGPKTMLPLIREIKKVCKGPVAALPVGYRTDDEHRTYFTFKDEETGANLFPTDIECKKCCSSDIKKFGLEAKELGLQYVGICCGNCASYMRELAEAYGRKPEASRYSADTSLSFVYGNKSDSMSALAKKERQYMVIGK